MNLTLTLPESTVVQLQRRAKELNVALDDLAWKLFNDGLMAPTSGADTLPTNLSEEKENGCLSAFAHAVKKNSVIEITQHGEPVAVILSIHEYRALKEDDKDFWTEYLKFYTNNDMKNDGLIGDEFTDLRDRTPGREVNLWH